jgi:hypothetical protein
VARRCAALAVTCVAALLASAGCGSGDSTGAGDPTTDAASPAQSSQRPAGDPGALPAEAVVPARCPAEVDPQGISFRGLTSIDVRAGLRPDPLPKVGDLISAAGPVQTGSFGQDQIHALVLHVGSPD